MKTETKHRLLIAQPGTYALVLTTAAGAVVQIGKVGTLRLQPGFYVYVGSAFGPGGLVARIRHHQRIAVRPHWHIDYLRMVCDLAEIWFAADTARREHVWAKALAKLPRAAVPMPGFGSSDCDRETHLFCFSRKPCFAAFRQRVRTPVSRVRTAGV